VLGSLLVHGRRTECGESAFSKPQHWGGIGPVRLSNHKKKLGVDLSTVTVYVTLWAVHIKNVFSCVATPLYLHSMPFGTKTTYLLSLTRVIL